MKKMILLSVMYALTAWSQERYVVSPNNELIPIRDGESASVIIQKLTNKMTPSGAESGVIFGNPPDKYPLHVYLNMWQREVVGQWYAAKASGTIDTIFWWGGENGAKDSLVFLRIHGSKIGPDYGPGIGMYANAPPCQNWGYWLNSLDLQTGIAAFPDDATDTTWFSTIDTKGGTIPPSRPPFNFGSWGLLGWGQIHRRGVNAVCVMDAGEPCSVKIGEKFFISFRINGGFEHLYYPYPTQFGAWQSSVPSSTNDENWPSRLWKFYKKDSGAANCAGNPIQSVKRGWVARGPFVDDPAYTSSLNIWYSMTVTTNIPPKIFSVPGGDPHTTSSTSPQTVVYEISDSDPADPENAYVQSAIIEWWKSDPGKVKNFIRQTDIPMFNTGPGDIWTGTLPGMQPGNIMLYKVKAFDAGGLYATGSEHEYKITFENYYFWIDTNTTAHNHEFGSGTSDIPYTDFFLPPDSCPYTSARDDGTAGPFPLGTGMPLLSDTMNYIWVGINGAIALSESPTDTIHLNARGEYYADWDLPGREPVSLYGSYCSVIIDPPLPKNIIAPLWTDLILAGEGGTPDTYGHIRCGTGLDTNLFIIEWDSIGIRRGSSIYDDAITFRIVLNRFDGSIQYQYENMGSQGADTLALVGLHRDEEYPEGEKYGNVFLNKNGYPMETRPRNNWCVTLWPGAPLYVDGGWHLISLSYYRGAESTYCRIYPTPCGDSYTFRYEGSYVQKQTFINGAGYWVKLAERTYAGAPGLPIYDMMSPVSTGWNMIGTISKPVLVTDIDKDPPDMQLSEFFGYDVQYFLANTLLPGNGYWIKSDQAGNLLLHYSSLTLAKQSDSYRHLNKIIVSDQGGNKQTLYIVSKEKSRMFALYEGEMPPAMPEFDARFTNSGGMVAVYPEKINESIEYPLTVSTENLPLTIQWSMTDPPEQTPCITQNNRIICRLVNEGTIQIPTTEKLAITLRDMAGLPTEFALHQNFPNPFNPATKIRYELPSAVHVQLKIFSLLGQEVITLIDDDIDAGYHEVEWDASAHAGGVYFIKITAGIYAKVGKMLLIK